MDTFQFPQPRARLLIHHARFHEQAAASSINSSAIAQAEQHQQTTDANIKRTNREVWRRNVDEHPLNHRVEIFVPNSQNIAKPASSSSSNTFSAASVHSDPIRFFNSVATPAAASATSSLPSLFYTSALVPFSSLLDSAFLRRYILKGKLFARSVRSPLDHANAVQITPRGLLRMYVDTDTFELLGIDASDAHSAFKECSSGNIKTKSNVRERILTVDLVKHAVHEEEQEKKKKAAAATSTSTDSPAPDPKIDRRLERLRWALGRCPPIQMHLLYLDETGNCAPIELPGALEVKRVTIDPSLHRFGQQGIAIPNLAAYTAFLPPHADAAGDADEEQISKKQKTTENTSSSPHLTVSSTSVQAGAGFPSLADGTNAQEVWTDVMNYLGLVHSRLSTCLSDPNNQSNSNLFLQRPLCPYLQFESADGGGKNSAEDAESEEEKEEEEDIISLTVSKKKSSKRKRGPDASNSSIVLNRSTSAYSVSFEGLIASSHILHLVSQCRALLASDSSLPFLAISVFGFDDVITSWRDKQHQRWNCGRGAGGESGGGENHYTLLLLPEGPDHSRTLQQCVLLTMIGELDQTS